MVPPPVRGRAAGSRLVETRRSAPSSSRSIRFWLDRGIDGFRIDVAHGLTKDPALPDLGDQLEIDGRDRGKRRSHPHWDRDELHDVYRAWRAIVDQYAHDPMFVAEAWVSTPERLARFVRSDELHTAFNFDLLEATWDAAKLRKAIDSSNAADRSVGAPSTWVLENHDVQRVVTRYGGGAAGTRRARAGMLLILALPGNAYLYQGQELALEEVLDLPANVREDPVFILSGGERLGRDGCRVPIPWTRRGPSLGFGPAPGWLPQPGAWAGRSVEAQDGGSRVHAGARAVRAARPSFGAGTGRRDAALAEEPARHAPVRARPGHRLCGEPRDGATGAAERLRAPRRERTACRSAHASARYRGVVPGALVTRLTRDPLVVRLTRYAARRRLADES